MFGKSPGGKALAELDRALAAKPDADGNAFSLTIQYLSAMRDTLAAAHRSQGADAAGRRRLGHVNAVISVVLAGHFPIGDVPWAELQKARGWLAELVDAA